jgi:nitrogen fixation/metabolism regulation signal transduction histidine kinase
VRQVAAGDLTAKPVFAQRDELGGLTRSFADMTAQVADARAQVQRGVAQLEGARTRLQTILDTLTAGVIVFDREGRIDTVNPGATRILQRRCRPGAAGGCRDCPSCRTSRSAVEQRFELLATSPEAGERDQWQDSFELQRGDGARSRCWCAAPRCRATHAADGLRRHHRGRLGPAQRRLGRGGAAAGARDQEPAHAHPALGRAAAAPPGPQARGRRPGAAHALGGHHRQPGAGHAALVNEFRDYARLPAAQMQPLDLNALASEVLALYGQAQDNGLLCRGWTPACRAILGDATQLRQVIHNLVQNALDAVADRPDGQVELITSAARGEHGELRAVRLTVIDNGPGFADKVLKRAFEPYVTTKAKGTGLGLAVVKKIADEHGARLRVANLHQGDEPDGPVTGARVSLSFSNFARRRGRPEACPRSAPPAQPAATHTQVH